MTKVSIRPDATNANKGTERGRYMVETSLRETGAGRSILLDADGRIIAGNKTFEAATDIGLPVRIVETDGKELIAVQRVDLDLSDPTGTARKLAYYDNRASQVGLEWDAEQVLADITAGVDLDAMFRHDELDELLKDLLPKTEGDAAPQIDRAAELNEVWQVQPGDLWQIGEHRLVCGDCTDHAVVAKVMQNEQAALVATSPPYFVGKDYEKDSSWSDFLLLISGFIKAASDILIQGGYLFVNFSENTNKPIAMAEVYRRCSVESGLEWHSHRVWKRPADLPIYASTTPRPCNEIEYLHTYRKRGGKEVMRDIKISSRMLWETGGPEKLGHDAAFSADLIAKPITIYTDTGAIVYEPFCGSGTTLVACQNLGRRGRGIEVSPAYCAVILQRMQDAFGITGVRLE